MFKKLLLLGLLISLNSTFGQINFENEKNLLNQIQMPSLNSEILAADLNGDGDKDLITTSLDLGYITAHPNIGGDLTDTAPKIILENRNEYPSGISAIDADNDGLTDIIACNRYDNKINWFKNLGNFTFSPISTLLNIANEPNLSVISDIDNDGLSDIVVNLASNGTIVWLKNSGNGTFQPPQIIYDNANENIRKITTTDLNNDGYPEIILGISNNYVHWIKNLAAGTFEANLYVAYVNSANAYDFEDINNDNYPDLIFASGTNLITKVNMSGTSFGANQISNITPTLSDIKFKDIDHDGLKDLVGTTGSTISYLKRMPNGSFQNPISLINASSIRYFIADDFNNDSYTDFIIPSYNNSSSDNTRRLCLFTGNSTFNSYTERLISYFNGAVLTVKIADLDNDGKNDVISAYKSVVWNKNKGGANFTSYKKISNSFPFDTTFSYDIEIADIDNDNDQDVISITNTGLEIYYNDGNGNFTQGYTTTLPNQSRNIEVADINGDTFKDIIMTFRTGASSGNISLAWIPNLTGNSFGTLTTIGISAYGYEPFLLVCTDMDNDNDIDIVSYSNEFSRIHIHTNDGNGTFTTNWLSNNTVSAVCLAVEDFDNDGDKDIFTGGNYYAGIYLIKNNNGSFATKSLIDLKRADALEFKDLNNDGLKELIGTATENSNLGTIFYFLNNGTSFSNQVVLNSNTYYSLSRNLAVGDLNNDNKPDIVNSFYLNGKVSYFLNNSTLSLDNLELTDGLSFYPIPFSETLKWETTDSTIGNYNISIYNTAGSLVFSKRGISTSFVDLTFLPKGIYLVNLKSESKSYLRKIIKN